MDFINVTAENIEKEHICCAIASEKDCQVLSKKEWLKARFQDGLVFRRADARGKCFIEYLPAEKAWVPVEADGYMYIDCLWVSGQFAGQGYAGVLLDDCIADAKAKGRMGLVTLSSDRKRPFLSDPKFLIHKGFMECDACAPYFTLMCLPFAKDAKLPKFSDSVRRPPEEKKGFALYYTQQCPYTAKYVPLIAETAEAHGAPFVQKKLDSAESAKCAPSPFSSYTLYFDGEFVTNEILSVPKFTKLLAERGY